MDGLHLYSIEVANRVYLDEELIGKEPQDHMDS